MYIGAVMAVSRPVPDGWSSIQDTLMVLSETGGLGKVGLVKFFFLSTNTTSKSIDCQSLIKRYPP